MTQQGSQPRADRQSGAADDAGVPASPAPAAASPPGTTMAGTTMAAESEATIARREGEDGFGFLRRVARRLPQRPGVYRMLGADGKVLYVGKARILRNRVGSYAQAPRLTARIMRMVEATRALEIVTTHTETEALLLEANLIKRLKPHYNVILRDDKSFPYILIRDDHPYPRITKYRGAKTVKGDYFGPFASAGSVNRTLAALARVFPLRSCSDGDFATRTRPCLQYQIKRCTAPCVGRIDEAGYAALVGEARDFLAGRNTDLQQRLGARMEEAATEMNYEAAAMYRDRLRALAHVTAHQDINVASLGEADVIAAWAENGQTCIQVFFFRAGQNFGNRPYYPAHAGEVPMAEVLAAFIGQFYEERPAPKQVLVSHEVENAAWLAEALGDERIRNHREALKQRLATCGGLGLEELEYAVRVMLMSGRFAGTQVRPLPPGVDPAKIETYLNDTVFRVSSPPSNQYMSI